MVIPALVSLGAGGQQLALIEAARAAGLAVITVDRNATAPGHALATHALVMSTHEPEAILSALLGLDPRLEFRAVVCRSTGRALDTQSHLSRALGVRGLTPEAVRISTSKSELRRFCLEHRIAMPSGTRVSGAGRVSLELPLVVKPDYTVVGKRDVRRVVSRAALPEAIANAASSSWNGLAEVEAFVDGVDVACVFWAEHGHAQVLACYDEVLGFASDGTVVPLGVSAPTLVDHTSQDRIHELAGVFARALVGTAAFLILCVRVDPRGAVHVIEMHADLGGDRIAEELLPASMQGFDYFATVVALATGDTIQPVNPDPAQVAVLYRGEVSGGGSHLDATRLVQLDSRAELLSELKREVQRHGSSVAVAPPVLRLATAA